MRNQPKYHLFKNTKYALDGLLDVIKNETSFKLELILFITFQIILIFLPLDLKYKFVISISMFLPLLAEIANSAIERVVDLVTLEYHEMAKRAKDVGSFLVFFSFTTMFFIWIFIAYLIFIGE